MRRWQAPPQEFRRGGVWLCLLEEVLRGGQHNQRRALQPPGSTLLPFGTWHLPVGAHVVAYRTLKSAEHCRIVLLQAKTLPPRFSWLLVHRGGFWRKAVTMVILAVLIGTPAVAHPIAQKQGVASGMAL